MIRSLAFVLALLCAGPVSALSCIRPDVAYSYQSAAESEDIYVVLLGDFSFRPSRQPAMKGDDPNAAEPAPPVPARFSGRYLTASGFGGSFNGTVTIEPVCFGPWCGGFPNQGEGLAFVRKSGDTFTLIMDPCGGNYFPTPSRSDVARVEACHRGDACTPDG